MKKELTLPTNIRVLILEDRPEDAELMIHELRRSQFDPEWRRVDTESEYNAHLGWQPDVILSDYNMPLLDAPRALDLLHQLDLDIPFIVVSGAIGEEVAVAMMRRGATDYLLKDRLTRLGAAVRRALDERQLREETLRAGHALRASELRFYSFMNNNPALALIKDEEGRILYVNNACEQMWGLSLAECLGRTNQQLWPAEVAEALSASDQAALQHREASRTMEEVTPRGKSPRQMVSFRFPFAEADGQRLLGVVSMDVTQQVRTQRELAAALASKEILLKELHHRVKNNLQIISSLLAMQAESLQGAAAAKAFRESQERVQCMALIHERLDGHDQPDQLDFREYVEALARDLFYSYGADSASHPVALRSGTGLAPAQPSHPLRVDLERAADQCLEVRFSPRASRRSSRHAELWRGLAGQANNCRRRRGAAGRPGQEGIEIAWAPDRGHPAASVGRRRALGSGLGWHGHGLFAHFPENHGR